MKIEQIKIPTHSKPKTKHLSLASRFRLAAHYLEGMAFDEMSLRYGITEDTIRAITRRFGCPSRPRYFKGQAVEDWCAKWAYD